MADVNFTRMSIAGGLLVKAASAGLEEGKDVTLVVGTHRFQVTSIHREGASSLIEATLVTGDALFLDGRDLIAVQIS